MSITVPYAYYQPYYLDSSRTIPVEMFMGRKEQLEDIESPKGANIICGGRQLGKSALLRMAKADIDNNENEKVVLLNNLMEEKTLLKKHLDEERKQNSYSIIVMNL